MKAIVYEKYGPVRCSSTQRDETVNPTKRKSNNFIVRRPLLPFPLAFVAAGLYRLAGGAASGNISLSMGFWAGLIILNWLQGATGEEAGWRGFAPPHLQEIHGLGKASLILGLIWGFWHLPLWFLSGYSGLDLLIYILAFSVSIISLTFSLTWLSNKTPNSLIPIVIIHFSFNASLNLVDARGLGFGPTLPLLVIMSGLYLLTAILVWSARGRSTQKTQSNRVHHENDHD